MPVRRRDNAAMTHPSRADRLHAALTQTFAPAMLRVEDDSAHHAGHSGAQEGGQSHYSVLLVSAAGNYLAWREVFGHADNEETAPPTTGIAV